MSRRIENPNLPILRQWARERELEIVSIRRGAKHLVVTLRNHRAGTFVINLNKGKVDPKKLVDWFRQSLAAARRRTK